MLQSLKRVIAYLRLFLPILVPTSSQGVENLANDLIELYGPHLDLVIKRRVAEAILHGANKHIFVLKLRFYNEIRMAMSAGAGFAALENVKKEEKEREQQRQQEVSGPTTNLV